MRLSGHSCSSVHGERLSFSTAHCTQRAAGSDRIIIIIKNEPVRPLNTIERCINNVITNNNNNSRRQSLNDLDGGMYRYNIILLLECANSDSFIPDSVHRFCACRTLSRVVFARAAVAIMSKIEILSRPRATRLYRFQRGHRVNRVCCKSNRPR